MALPAIGSSNFGIYGIGSAIGEGCGVQQSTNISLASLHTGGTFNGIQNTFSSIGGPVIDMSNVCLLYTSPSPRDRQKSRMPSSA